MAAQELTIDGIRPPPANVVFSIAGATPTVQTVRPAGIPTNQVRIVTPGTTVVRPAQVSRKKSIYILAKNNNNIFLEVCDELNFIFDIGKRIKVVVIYDT